MNKLRTALCLLSILACNISYGADTIVVDDILKNHFPENYMDIGSLRYKNQQAATFLGVKILDDPNHAQGNPESFTQIFSFLGKSDAFGREETVCHVGWYSDGYIVTHVNGDKKGYQTVVRNNEIIGSSYPSEISSNGESMYCTHKYSWGLVRTSQTEQSIERF